VVQPATGQSKHLLAMGLAAITLCCCTGRPLPEAGSRAAELYAMRCGSCHQAYDPRSLTAAMWEIQIAAMRAKIAEAGQPQLSADEEHRILQYLRRNAGSQ
jgi:hypothetical protein